MRLFFKPTFKTILPALALLACLNLSEAKKVRTRLKPPVKAQQEVLSKQRTYPRHLSQFDRVRNKLTFMAYDKKAGSDKETFFVDNGSDVSLSGIEVEISYYNEAGKLIHRRTVELDQSFPAKETRKTDITSWDRQKSFHYINSVPSPKGSTPYTVRFRVLSFKTAEE